MADNKTDIRTSWGDANPLEHSGNDQAGDYAHDIQGIPSDGGPSTKTDMALTLEPNKFPRQKGHDSLSEEEAYLS